MSEDLTTKKGFNAAAKVDFAGHLDIYATSVQYGVAETEMFFGPQHLTVIGSMHGAGVVGIVDRVCGAGCQCFKLDGATRFTTIELKRNFLATATSGLVTRDARMIQSGRNTQVWDADVACEDGRVFASFLCSQMVLWPKP